MLHDAWSSPLADFPQTVCPLKRACASFKCMPCWLASPLSCFHQACCCHLRITWPLQSTASMVCVLQVVRQPPSHAYYLAERLCSHDQKGMLLAQACYNDTASHFLADLHATQTEGRDVMGRQGAVIIYVIAMRWLL